MMLTQQGKAFATRLDHLSSIPRAPTWQEKTKIPQIVLSSGTGAPHHLQHKSKTF